ncbi:MAG: hypothetical protein M1840_006088 [Geoglossum simile]|nr:MAG: hypothetical protein M1840_006088 [Geoglossum simile]
MGIGHSKTRRRNSTDSYKNLQFSTDRSSVAADILYKQANRAPRPGTKTRSRYPHEYRNYEKRLKPSRELFHPKEVKQAGAPLYEIPIVSVDPERHREFDFGKRVAKAKKMLNPGRSNDRRHMLKPKNDAGAIRAIIGQNRQVMGAVIHPIGDEKGFDRANLEPIDIQRRKEQRTYQDRTLPRVRGVALSNLAPLSATWPQR